MNIPEELVQMYRHVKEICYPRKERERMVVKHHEPEKARECPWCTKPTKLGILSIDDASPDRGKKWVYCKGCSGSGPAADNITDAVTLWNARKAN